jgi:dolichol-phosphate mannosyltransferase
MISIVVPVFNEEGNIEELFKQLKRNLVGEEFEVVFVDDGSSDASLSVIKALAKNNKQIHFISFSRNFGHQAALRAGLARANGDAIISMDADLQHPPRLVPKLIKKWREGYAVVYTIREDDKSLSWFKRSSSLLFYKLMGFLSDLDMEPGAADFRLLDKKVVKTINQQDESQLFLRGYIKWVGFNQVSIAYTPAKRFAGQSKYTFRKMIHLASQGVTQFSVKPLRLAHAFAALAFAASILYILYAVVVSILGQAIPGWLSLVVLIVFLQGVQFLLLGLIGEYLGKSFMQAKRRPEYIVDESSLELRE